MARGGEPGRPYLWQGRRSGGFLARLAAGDLTDIAVALRRVDPVLLQAWDH